MTISNADDTPRESERMSGPEAIPGDELYMITGRVFILCSVTHPSTRWISAAAVAELDDWQ
ncbi:hypothetical protein [Halosolutus gelatinilyticus]|uniref:hypothetical protein n=1 Tax=Halosolutus gelatinilyticus TaxID=2931975 RepID=UPI001FF52E4C|nr:hypothetical protein [Halosolutus gelatinilyticus]